jgi:hypothetical protein
MTWIKIKYLQFNNLKALIHHTIPFFYKNYHYYKIETEIINKFIIYIYVNISFINNSIPQKRELIELLNYVRQDFKFNKHYFNKYYKYINKQDTIINKLNKNILIKCVNNNSIVLNNRIINLSKKKILKKTDYKYISLNTYFLFNVKNPISFIDIFNNHTKKILIISKNNNYGKDNTVLIDNKFTTNIIKKTDFDLIIIINCLETILNNNYFSYINNLGCKNIFMEQNYNLDYNNYIKIKDMVFNKEFNNDLYLNINFIKNNLIICYNKINNINTSIIRINTIKDLPLNINVYGTLVIFESLLEKYNINYELCVDDNKNSYCSVSNINLKNKISIVFNCNHCVSFRSFLYHLNYNNLCPICNASLFNTTIKLKSSEDVIINTLLSSDIVKNISYKLFNLVILNKKLNYKTDLNLIYLNNRVKKINNALNDNYKIRFISIDNFNSFIKESYNSIKDINIYIIYEKDLTSVIKYKILNRIESLNITNLTKLNLIKCN